VQVFKRTRQRRGIHQDLMHVSDNYDDSGSFVCNMCGRHFATKKACTLHISTHLGKSTCPVCNRVLSRVSHMRRHMKNVHGLAL
jgi:C2H2-type zinc finger/Zinc finger, C2H2 type